MLIVLIDNESSFFKGESPNSWGVSDDRLSQRIMKQVVSVSQKSNKLKEKKK